MKVYTKMKQSKRKTIHFFIIANNKDFFYTKETQETCMAATAWELSLLTDWKVVDSATT